MTKLEPGVHASTRPGAPAVVMGESGVIVTYAELDARSKRGAQSLRAAVLGVGDHLAVMLENSARYFEIVWGALRAGLYITPINWHLKPEEVGYIIEDCGARAFITSEALADLAAELEPSLATVPMRLMVGGMTPAFRRYEDEIEKHAPEALADEYEGSFMFYSSGTTGRPKGIVRSMPLKPFGSGGGPIMMSITERWGFTRDSVYLSPAPLYHAAPLNWSITAQRWGATVVVMERFDPARCLSLIQRYRVTHAQFVPTHFVRLLRLPAEVRSAFDTSSLESVVHAAAPCPVDIKREMIDWWGPIINEYYGGSESNGMCTIDADEWLSHPGSVGRPLVGSIHILDSDGNEQPVGHAGEIWFDSDMHFTYHNDPAKTANAYNDRGWSTLGDIGYVDAEGYLYLTDRLSHMIISGGVNIYPQEVENVLTVHPAVADVAVIGVPNADFGEEVKAVVVAAEPSAAGDELARTLIEYARSKLAHYKCPVSVDFVAELPRLPTGKLLKRELRDEYWGRGGD